jgi:acyl-CoA reductase-like NAD-dependent aldehyde dehydrogenase
VEVPSSAELVAESLPAISPGVFNLTRGHGEAGRSLIESDVDGIAFTGSVEVGREMARQLQRDPAPSGADRLALKESGDRPRI